MKKLSFLLMLAGIFYINISSAQEIRVQGNMLFLGYIEKPFVGAGAGIEAPFGKHFSANIDANWGSHQNGSSIELRPSFHYYPGMDQKGFFTGIAFKYISLNDKEGVVNSWESPLYSIGIHLGVKASLSDKLSLVFVASPHKTIGGSEEGDVAGISSQIGVGVRI